jgi:hypothetical protein
MAGLIVAINGKPLASVSDAGLNILTVQVHGDVLGEELSVLDVHGGLYGHGDADKHLIWVNGHEVSADDEVEIAFRDQVSTSDAGKTIEELYPESNNQEGAEQSIEDLASDLSQRPKLRDRFTFELLPPGADMIRASTETDDFSYHLSAMWNWKKPDQAKVSLTSNSIEKIARREDGSRHAAFVLRFGEKTTFRIGI